MQTRILAAVLVSGAIQLWGADAPPKSWVDADTGHRVVRLTDEPGSASLYFNQNGYTADGKKLVYSMPEGIGVLDLETKQARRVVTGRVRIIETGHKGQNVYYTKGDAAWVANVETGEAREIGKLPKRGGISAVNADETLLAGSYIEGDGQDYNNRNPANGSTPAQAQGHALEQPLNKGQMMEQRLAARLPMALFTMNTKTGEVKVLHKATDWLGHLLFSPADPGLLMFCHEGPWHKVDRIWTIRTDGTQLTKIHTRTMLMEIAGHEFWSADGRTIWYDLQTPRGEVFWLAGYRVDTGERTWYHLSRNEWSIHFNVTQDGKLFTGDGGDEGQVAHAPDGRWIYLFRPELTANKDGIMQKGFAVPGVLRSERLVNMSKHNYRLEPNVSFTPDQKWVVFRSNMFGPTYVFAVEVAKASGGVSGAGTNPVVLRNVLLLLLLAVRLNAQTANVPTLWLVGDSTVRNGSGQGGNGQWGWGEPLAEYFDPAKIRVVNRALGGRSSRTFITEGRWEKVVAELHPGDFVLIQFGHNDSGPLDDTSRARGTLPGIGEETREIENPILKKHEVVHTYGWYLRQYVREAKEKGATPIVCSMVARKIWQDGHIVRATPGYGGWAADVANAEHVPFLDLNEIIARRYDQLGPERVEPLFADEHTHTSWAGADLNAACVVAGLKALSGDPLGAYVSARGRTVESWVR